jgi:hypothetical protein
VKLKSVTIVPAQPGYRVIGVRFKDAQEALELLRTGTRPDHLLSISTVLAWRIETKQKGSTDIASYPTAILLDGDWEKKGDLDGLECPDGRIEVPDEGMWPSLKEFLEEAARDAVTANGTR